MNKRIESILLISLMVLLGACERTAEVHPVIHGMAPNLAVSPNGTAVVSYLAPAESGRSLQFHVIKDGHWGDAQTVATGENWFINWADFPSVIPITDSMWAAHWLVRRKAGGYAYDVHASVTEDSGQTWSTPFLLHSDGTDTEHGFVTLYPAGDQIGAVWLDGRNTAEESETFTGMTLRSAHFSATGVASNEQVVDELTCDCCQTDVAISTDGPVAVYRNRTTDEIRDIYVSRYVDGTWQPGQVLNDDGWNIAGCPVNGPVIKAMGSTVVVSWFTSANDEPKVKTAWSFDAGQTFGPPIVVADANVRGYVGSALISDDNLIVSWICKTSSDRNAICYQDVNADGHLGELKSLETHGVVARMSVPQLAKVDDNLLFVWTDKVNEQAVIKSAVVLLH